VLTKLVWENMKTRCATSRQRLLSRLTTVERAWRPLVFDRLICAAMAASCYDSCYCRIELPRVLGSALYYAHLAAGPPRTTLRAVYPR
jgi:hypothetical protein